MVVAAAVGYRRALGTGVGGRWVPRLLAAYGASLVAAGSSARTQWTASRSEHPLARRPLPTLSGTLHFVSGSIGFWALILAAFLLARRFGREGRPWRAIGSIVTGVGFGAAVVGIASGSTAPAISLAFAAAVLLAWTWLSSTSHHLCQKEYL